MAFFPASRIGSPALSVEVPAPFYLPVGIFEGLRERLEGIGEDSAVFQNPFWVGSTLDQPRVVGLRADPHAKVVGGVAHEDSLG